MSPLLIKISKDFATIWTTIDPIGNLAIFAGLTAFLTRAERRRTALRATVYATVILVVAIVAGQIILDAIGIHLHSLKVAGGIILSSSVCKCSSDEWTQNRERRSWGATWPCFHSLSLPSPVRE